MLSFMSLATTALQRNRLKAGKQCTFFNQLFASHPARTPSPKPVRDGIIRAGEKQAIVYDKDKFALRTPEKKGHLLNLGNAYPEYCAAPKANRSEDREEIGAGVVLRTAWKFPAISRMCVLICCPRFKPALITSWSSLQFKVKDAARSPIGLIRFSGSISPLASSTTCPRP